MFISPRAYFREPGACVSNNFSKENIVVHVSRTETLRGGLSKVHLYYLLLARRLIVAAEGEFVLNSSPDK